MMIVGSSFVPSLFRLRVRILFECSNCDLLEKDRFFGSGLSVCVSQSCNVYRMTGGAIR